MAPRRKYLSIRSGEFDLAAVIDFPAEMGETAEAIGAIKVPAVFFCHGFTGHKIESRRSYARLSARLAAAGIACFRFDHRGCGESDGDFLDFTAAGMLEDLRAALAAFLALPFVDQARMGLVGYSLGGTSASYILSLEPRFRTAVYWAPVARPDIIRDRLSTLDGFSVYQERGYFDYGGFRVSPRYIDDIGGHTPLEWVANWPNPILFIHGEDDPIVVPDQSAQYMATRANAADRRILIPGADHGFTTAANFDCVIEESEKWLIEKLNS